jgi:hypothetical protein
LGDRHPASLEVSPRPLDEAFDRDPGIEPGQRTHFAARASANHEQTGTRLLIPDTREDLAAMAIRISFTARHGHCRPTAA